MVAMPAHARQLSIAALVVFCGIVLSGPVAVTLVELLAPQPVWRDVATFREHYSWIQTLPYLFGFLIAGGFVLFMSALPANEEQKWLKLSALTFTGIAASLIFFNYVMQTALVPLRLRGDDTLLAVATMANPASFGWALEMYGYGILGVATACAAPLFASSGLQWWIRQLLIFNCVLSVVGAVLVPIFPGWVLTIPGMICGAAWNLLVAVLMVLVMMEFRPGKTD